MLEKDSHIKVIYMVGMHETKQNLTYYVVVRLVIDSYVWQMYVREIVCAICFKCLGDLTFRG